MKYVCRTKDCPDEGFVQEFTKISFRWDKDKNKLVGKETICPNCGAEMEEVDKPEITDFSSVNFGKFRGMSREQKTQTLMKRSRKDYQKNVKESADYKMGRAMKEMRDMVKGKI